MDERALDSGERVIVAVCVYDASECQPKQIFDN